MRQQHMTSWMVIAMIALALSHGAAPLYAQTWPGASWETATPESVGLSTQNLQYAQNFATSTGTSTGGSGCVIKNGKRVWSWGNTTQTYDISAVTKSIGSTALGLAIGSGSVNQHYSAQVYLPSLGTPPESNATDQADLLIQVSLYTLAANTGGFTRSGGFTPLTFEPGTFWHYSDSGYNWMADALTVVFGDDLLNAMTNQVFNRIGIPGGQVIWRDNAYRSDTIEDPDDSGVFYKRRELAAGISASVDALARFGYLWLRDGQWNGQQIIPASYVAQARSPLLTVSGVLPVDPAQPDAALFAEAPRHYGLGWWNNSDGVMSKVPTDAFWAWGEKNDTLVIVIPSMDLVAVRTGNVDERWDPSGTRNYISVIEPFFELLLGQSQPPPPINVHLPGDANGDGRVDIADLQIVTDNWLMQDATWSDGDFNGDGTVDLSDLQILNDNWQLDLTSLDIPGLLPGDANYDGQVNLADLQILNDHWLSEDATWLMGEFSGDGVVGLADLQILIEHWSDNTAPDLSAVGLESP